MIAIKYPSILLLLLFIVLVSAQLYPPHSPQAGAFRGDGHLLFGGNGIQYEDPNRLFREEGVNFHPTPTRRPWLSFGPAAAFRRRQILNFDAPSALDDDASTRTFQNMPRQPPAQPFSNLLRKPFSWGSSSSTPSSNKLPPVINKEFVNMNSMRRGPVDAVPNFVLAAGQDPTAARALVRLAAEGGDESGDHHRGEWWGNSNKRLQQQLYPPQSGSLHRNDFPASTVVQSKLVSQYPLEVAALISDVGEGAGSGDEIPNNELITVVDDAAAELSHKERNDGSKATTVNSRTSDSLQRPTTVVLPVTTKPLSPTIGKLNSVEIEVDPNATATPQTFSTTPSPGLIIPRKKILIDEEDADAEDEATQKTREACRCEASGKDLVCGNDGVTYWNKCTLFCEKKTKQKMGLRMKSRGQCERPTDEMKLEEQASALVKQDTGQDQVTTTTQPTAQTRSNNDETPHGDVSFVPVNEAIKDLPPQPNDGLIDTDQQNQAEDLSTETNAVDDSSDRRRASVGDHRPNHPCEWECSSSSSTNSASICDSTGSRHASECEFWRAACITFQHVRQTPRRVACSNDATRASELHQQLPSPASSILRPHVVNMHNVFSSIGAIAASRPLAEEQRHDQKVDSSATHKLTRSIKIHGQHKSPSLSFAAENLKWKKMFEAKTVPTVPTDENILTPKINIAAEKLHSPVGGTGQKQHRQLFSAFERTFDDADSNVNINTRSFSDSLLFDNAVPTTGPTSPSTKVASGSKSTDLVNQIRRIFQGWKKLSSVNNKTKQTASISFS